MSQHPDPAEFRGAASRFLTGVTVVTSIDGEGQAIGMTANSFTTISVRPPSVLVSLTPGRTARAVATSGRYCVNVLPADALTTSLHFAGQPVVGTQPELRLHDGFAVLDEAIAQFACEVVREIEIADHTLFIGEVRWCRQSDGTPLGFYSSTFRAGTGSILTP
jgi:flavin reductase (DIM6/NTAB) family NADH-FMN oxidoreductase RutF